MTRRLLRALVAVAAVLGLTQAVLWAVAVWWSLLAEQWNQQWEQHP